MDDISDFDLRLIIRKTIINLALPFSLGFHLFSLYLWDGMTFIFILLPWLQTHFLKNFREGLVLLLVPNEFLDEVPNEI